MPDKTVVLLGGGVGGVVAANELRRRLKDRARVVLVDRSAQQSFAPSFLWVMTGARKPKAITRDLNRLARKGIEVVTSEVRSIDPLRHVVALDSRELAYDFLVVALGAELAPEVVPGLAEAHTYYDLAGAERLRDALSSFEGGRVAIVVGSLPYKCPAAPYEGAMLLESYFHARHMRQRVELAVYTPEPQPLPVAGPALGEAVCGLLAHKGIAFHPGKKLAAVEGGELRFEDGTTAPFDLLIAVPPHRAPRVAQAAGLTDESGWIPVEPHTLETQYEGVFAIGDVTRVPLPDGMALPKAGVFAHSQALVVARNIASRISGGDAVKRFDGEGSCFLETGGGAAGVARGNFYAQPRRIQMRSPSRRGHWGKIAFERYWLWKWY
jgi:sulfide:quinone oxidoreductase